MPMPAPAMPMPAPGSASRSADGRVVLAGEACRTDGLAGTVGGAMRDGERAAQAVLDALSGG